MRPRATPFVRLPFAGALALVLTAGAARADDLRVHGLGGGTLPVGGTQGKEYGAGGGGAVALELPLVSVFGLQAEGGALAQSKAARPADPTIADHGAGMSLWGAFGGRLRPFGGGGRVGGPWIDANIGIAETGGASRMTFDAHVGHDFRVGNGRFDIGPFAGYTQIVQPKDTLRPDDAHILWLGVHVSLGAPLPPPPRPIEVAKIEPPKPKPVEPPPPPAPVAVADRDNDAVPDAEDACPDVPGLPSVDPKRNGCPAESEHVRVEGMQIVLDDIIHFESDSPRVRRVSYALIRHVAEYIRKMDDVLEVDIEGHADITGTEGHNQWLSEMRAKSVRRLLVEFGVPADKLTTRGHGELEPRVPGNTEVQFRENRRVDFTITRARARDDASRPPEATAHTGSTP